jgi:hypothetical protein
MYDVRGTIGWAEVLDFFRRCSPALYDKRNPSTNKGRNKLRRQLSLYYHMFFTFVIIPAAMTSLGDSRARSNCVVALIINLVNTDGFQGNRIN